MKPRHVALTVVLAAGLALPACGTSAAGGQQASPDKPVSSSPQPGGATPAPGGDQGAKVVKPRSGMAKVHPIRWERAEPAKDGRSVRIFFTSGVEPCNVLDHVDVAYTDRVVVTLHEGSDAHSPNQVCIEIALTKAVDVPLDQPLGQRTVVDGAPR
jgi:hypothetical protein